MVYSCPFRDDHLLESLNRARLSPQAGGHADIQEEVDGVDLAAAAVEDPANDHRPLEGLASLKVEVRGPCHCEGLDLDCGVFRLESLGDRKVLAYLAEVRGSCHCECLDLMDCFVFRLESLRDQKALSYLGEACLWEVAYHGCLYLFDHVDCQPVGRNNCHPRLFHLASDGRLEKISLEHHLVAAHSNQLHHDLCDHSFWQVNFGRHFRLWKISGAGYHGAVVPVSVDAALKTCDVDGRLDHESCSYPDHVSPHAFEKIDDLDVTNPC